MHLDFEGLSDGESIIKILESLKPKWTIVVRGLPESCQALKNVCLSTGKTDFKVANKYVDLNLLAYLGSSDNPAFIARKGETIVATIESHTYQVRLKDYTLFTFMW
jgi:hypothetical protein